MPSAQAWERRLPEELDFAVVAPQYPRSWRRGGEFIRSRVRAYAAAGLRGVVIDVSGSSSERIASVHDHSTPIFVTGVAELPHALGVLRGRGVPVLAHSPTPHITELLHELTAGGKLAIWYHGYEVRDYRRLRDNFTGDEMALRGHSLDELNRTRFEAARQVFADPDVTIVFVSDLQRRNSEFDVGAKALNHHIIPNHIDTDLFRFRRRRPEEANRLLLMRSFATHNYGNDIAIEALRILSSERWFADLHVTIRGFGPLFKGAVKPLRRLANVSIQERYSSPGEMAIKHYDHGVFLCPSRYDTQGVMLGEAMASGMVTITNPVAAIPEFTDASCSLLPRPGDPMAFAGAIRHIVHNPDLMPTLSENAAARVERQCGTAATIDREIELIRRMG